MKSPTPMRVLLTIALTLALLPMFSSPALAADPGGTPDTAFTTNTGTGFNNGVLSVAVQANGKIVVGGFFTTLNGATVNRIARLNADGTPDTAFTTNTGTGFNGSVQSVAVQADGKIVVGGEFPTLGGATVNRIARLNADGTPDTAFTTNTGTGFNGGVFSVAVQADGKIVVGGEFTTLGVTGVNYIARLNADGTPDTAFTTNTGTGFNGGVYSVAVQADGKIVLGGGFTTLNGATVNRIARLNADGTPDTAFTTNTGTGFTAPGFPGFVGSVAVQADGKIVVGGEFTTLNGATVNYIARLNADGTPDTAFTTNTGTGFNNGVQSVAVQADGKIVLGGFFLTLNGAGVNRIARLNAAGTPDTAFTTNTGTGFNDAVISVAVQADGKIVLGGGFTTLNSVTGVNRIARLSGSGGSITSTDPSMWTSYRQALPLPASGFCSDITAEQDTFAAYNTGVTGGWVKGWEPWVNKNLDVMGERIGGFACWRNLVNTGGNNWRTTSTP